MEPRLQCFGQDGLQIAPSSHLLRPAVRELVFIGAHLPVPRVDQFLVEWRARQMPSHAELWLLLLDESPAAGALQQAAQVSHATRVDACVWTQAQVFRRLPLISAYLSRFEPYLTENDEHLKRYYWMHASLLLWNDTFAHAYPNYERLWRIEPDVMFTGNMSSLLARSAHVQSDLLLPHYVREAWDEKNAGWVHLKFRGRSNAAARNFTYYHWATHADVLGDYHSEVHIRSLVSIGRYSRRFLSLLYEHCWSRGFVMYEEILLPLACFAAGPERCIPGAWYPSIRAIPFAKLATHFRYRPTYFNEDFLDALQMDTREIWHPIKRRELIAAALGFTSALGSVAPAGWPPKLQRQARSDPDPADEEEER